MKNPGKTLQLLSLERLKNFYITIFKQSDSCRNNIVDYYLQLFNEESSSSEDLIELYESDIRPEDVRFLNNPVPRVSIIIPVHNQIDITLLCLKSIELNTQGIEYEVIVADDASSDDTVLLNDVIKNIKVVRNENNLGFLRNCNNAAQYASGKYITFLNNDTHVLKGWLQALLQTIERDKKIGLVGSKLIYPDGKLQEAGGVVFSDGCAWNYGKGDVRDKPEYNYVKEVDYVSGACFLIRKKLWDLIGGFDERYSPAYYEDTDLAFEVRKHGYKVLFQPHSMVVHFEGTSCGIDETSGVKRYQAINHEKFAQKWERILKDNQFKNSSHLFQARERSRNKTTILVIDHQVPLYDQDAGSRSTFQYLQWFVGRGFNVKFIGDNFYRDEPYTTALQQLGIEVLYGPWYAKNWKKWLRDNGAVFDYVYIHRPQIAAKYIDVIRKTTNAKIVFFGHDLHYLRTQRQYDVEKNEKLLAIVKEWRKKEFSIFSKADVIYYPSKIEVKKVKKHFPTATVRQIPLYIFDDIAPIKPELETRKDIFFVGGFRHDPNLDGVIWFINEVFPLIQSRLAEVKLFVAGSNTPESLRGLESQHIVIMGEISKEVLEKCYSQSRVFVAPLRYGAGIKGKVLEALSYQLPVVTTQCGAEGLSDAKNYLEIADDPKKFADQVVHLYRDNQLWLQRAENGRMFLLQNYSIERVTEILENDFCVIQKQ